VIDLHVHTTASDGRAPADEVLRRAAEVGVDGLVFTDHSVVTFDGLAEPAARYGVELPFPGVEISTFHGRRKYHILAYGPGVLAAGFRSYISFPNRRKNEVAAAVRDTLVGQGFALPPIGSIRAGSVPDAEPTPEKAYPSRTSIARCLASVAGISGDRAYRMVVDIHSGIEARNAENADHLARRYLPTRDVLAAAARVGAVTALAHPAWQCRTATDVDDVVADARAFRDAGLDGIETRSYHHRDFDDHPSILAARRELGLVPAGGSDYHANGKTELGSGGISPDAFAALRALVEGRTPVDADLCDLAARLPHHGDGLDACLTT
jgi:predicted metal-dependent phosphoesterase TrpH